MKKVLFIILAVLVSAVSFAAEHLGGVTLSINSKNGLYQKGEEVVFTVNRTDNPSSTYILSIFEDSILKSTEEVTVPEGRSRIFSFSSDSSKTVMVRLCDVNNNKVYQEVAATVDPYGYRTSFQEPADFQTYWKDQLKKMRKVKPVVKLTPMKKEAEGVDLFDLEISMHEGNPVRGYLAVPAGAKKKSAPVMLLTHGAGVNKPGNRSSTGSIIKYAKMGCTALDINAHGMLNDQPQEYYDALENGECKGYRCRILTTREDYYFRLMVLRAVRAIDYLCTRPEWDGKRVMAGGGSQGGYQTAAVAGLDRRVSFARVIVPAHTDLAGPRVGRKAAWPGCFTQAEAKTPELTDAILPYFDGAMFLKYAKGKVIVEAGLTDSTCPAGSVLAAYNNCQSKDKYLFTYPYRPHGTKDITEKARIGEWKIIVGNEISRMENEYISGKEDKSAVVYLLGDSTCSPYEEKHRPRFGWGEKLEGFLNGFKVEDRAASGRSSKSFINEGRWDKVMQDLKAGDYVFIQFSHNDEKLKDEKRGTQPFGEFSDNLRRFISETQSKGATPVLLTPVCRRAFNSDGSAKYSHKDYPAAIKKVGEETNTPVLDIELMTAEWLAANGVEGSKKFYMVSVNGKDNTHFTEEGATAVAGMVAKSLKESGMKNLSRLVK